MQTKGTSHIIEPLMGIECSTCPASLPIERNYLLTTAAHSKVKLQKYEGPVKAHLIELRPTATQASYLTRCAGTSRFVYNTLVAKWKAGDKYDRRVYQKHCVNLRQITPWLSEVSSRATYEAADNFHRVCCLLGGQTR